VHAKKLLTAQSHCANNREMKLRLLLAGAAFVPLIALSQVALPNAKIDEIDEAFVKLMVIADKLNETVGNWNAACGHPSDEAVAPCEALRIDLSKAFAKFIGLAHDYEKSGDGCAADLRVRVVNHEARLFAWNIDCAGVKLSPDKNAFCAQEKLDIELEQKEIERDVQQCMDDSSKSKL
jgi:hypothetical protein